MKHVINLIFNLQNLETLQAGKAADQKEAQGLRETIPEPILAHYDRLTSRGKKGVAVVRNRVCASCHMGVPVGAINTLINGDDLQLCGSCGRYLYMPPEEKASFLEPAAPPKSPKRKEKKARNTF